LERRHVVSRLRHDRSVSRDDGTERQHDRSEEKSSMSRSREDRGGFFADGKELLHVGS
jgi:hypothetical protein